MGLDDLARKAREAWQVEKEQSLRSGSGPTADTEPPSTPDPSTPDPEPERNPEPGTVPEPGTMPGAPADPTVPPTTPPTDPPSRPALRPTGPPGV